jgi:mRNA-degrading endonuclease RelE of RelBE toxin-antitoxin system
VTWQVRQTSRFSRTYKKLNDSLAAAVDRAVVKIAEDPAIGEKKKGDLAKLWVYKFRHQGTLYLLGYSKDSVIRVIYLEQVGPHENYSRDLKR